MERIVVPDRGGVPAEHGERPAQVKGERDQRQEPRVAHAAAPATTRAPATSRRTGRQRERFVGESRGEVVRATEPVGRQLGEGLLHGIRDIERHARPKRTKRLRLRRHQLGDDRLRARPRVRRLAGEHFVRHGAERVDVGAPVYCTISGCLLRRHVLWRAERQPRLRDALPARVAHRQCDPEVGDHGLAGLHQDVLGLEIAVDHAVLVCIGQRACDGGRDPHGVAHRELLLAVEPRAQRLALHIRHDIKEEPASLATVEQRQQIRMLQVRGDLDLAQEPLDAEHRAEFRLEHLEGDAPFMAQVARQVHGRHAAFADLAVNHVSIGERGSELVEGRDGNDRRLREVARRKRRRRQR